MPRIIKSSSSFEKPKSENCHSPNMGSPADTKSHEDSENRTSKSSSKVLCWESPDLSPGIELLIFSRNLCIVKNIIQLFNLDLEVVSNFFSRKDLCASAFQDNIIKVLYLGKDSQHLISC